MTKPKTNIVPTTNFTIDFGKLDSTMLQEKFQLLTIEIPEKFLFSKASDKYAKLHNTYKNQLNYPYYFFSYEEPLPTIYLLAPKSIETLPKLTLEFLDITVKAQKQKFTIICTKKRLHILVKLLKSSWFYEKHHNCQSDAFYLHGKGKGKRKTTLNVKLRACPYDDYTFQIRNGAKYLLKADKKYVNADFVNSDKFYERLQSKIYYKQLKTDHVLKWKKNESDTTDIWKAESKWDRERLKPKKPSIKWFEAYENYSRCRSNLLRIFQRELLDYYNEVFEQTIAKPKTYEMTKITPSQIPQELGHNDVGLYISLLTEIGVYDNRFKEKEEIENFISLNTYVSFFNKNYAEKYKIQFVAITKEELYNSKNPVLVLQDYEAKIFEKDSFLEGYDDPKEELYEEFAKRVALQTININSNKYKEHQIDTYFGYERINTPFKQFGETIEEAEKVLKQKQIELKEIIKYEKDILSEVTEETKEKRKYYQKVKNYLNTIKNKMEVCFSQLLLKYYIINNLPALNHTNNIYSLPCLNEIPTLINYAYMYQGCFMYFEKNGRMKFVDLRNVSGKKQRNEYLKHLQLDWFEIEQKFAQRKRTKDEKGQDLIKERNGQNINQHTYKLKNTRFVFTSEVALAIEDTEERVLHKYDPMQKGKSQRTAENVTALVDVFYSSKNNCYTVGSKKSLPMSTDDSVRIRKIHYYQKAEDFEIEGLLKTLTVEFVRNKQYTVYPCYFHLLNLYRDIHQINTASKQLQNAAT